MKLPKVNLKELAKDKASNKKQRRKFLDWYAARVRAGTA